jgi:hypothetical protein
MPRRTLQHIDSVHLFDTVRKQLRARRLILAMAKNNAIEAPDIDTITLTAGSGQPIKLVVPERCDCPVCTARRAANADSDDN